MKKRFVSLLLAISMILSLMPVSAVTAFAESENGGEVTTVDSGYCGADDGGENLRWTLDNNGVLNQCTFHFFCGNLWNQLFTFNFITPNMASPKMLLFILEVPNSRLIKITGTSIILKPHL